MEKQQQQYENQLEKQQKEYEYKQALQEQKAADAQALAQLKASFNVSRRGTGVSVEDKILLEEIKAYNTYVNAATKAGQPYDNYETWMGKRGYSVSRVSPTKAKTSTSSSSSASASQQSKSIDW